MISSIVLYDKDLIESFLHVLWVFLFLHPLVDLHRLWGTEFGFVGAVIADGSGNGLTEKTEASLFADEVRIEESLLSNGFLITHECMLYLFIYR